MHAKIIISSGLGNCEQIADLSLSSFLILLRPDEIIHLGTPRGVMRYFLPNLPIVMRQRILNKASVKKHHVDVMKLADMPRHLSSPIFVFKRSDDVLGVLTEMQDRDGKNICVAIELNRSIQNGGEVLEVNDIRSVHGRNVADIIYPILNNGTLQWVDKEKGLNYLSSASRYVQQEIDSQDLDAVAKIVTSFDNPAIEEEDSLLFRSSGAARAEYDAKVRTSNYDKKAMKRKGTNRAAQLKEAYLDSMRSLQVLQDAVSHESGKVVVESEVLDCALDRCGGFGDAVLQARSVADLGVENLAGCQSFVFVDEREQVERHLIVATPGNIREAIVYDGRHDVNVFFEDRCRVDSKRGADFIARQRLDGVIILKSASNLNGNLNCSKELEHYAS